MKTYSVYALSDPATGEVKYVGCTSLRPEQRLVYHCGRTELSRGNRAKNEWIKGLIGIGLRPKLLLIESVCGDGWQDREIYWIRKYREDGHPLLNITDGGLGLLGVNRPEEWKASQALRLAGRVVSEETRQKISEAVSIRMASPGARKKISRALSGRTASAETKQRISEGLKRRGWRPSPEHLAKWVGSAMANNHTPEAIQKSKRTKRLSGPRKPGTFKGVRLTKDKRWMAYIQNREGKAEYIGMFGTAEEAALARDNRAINLYGADVYLNFPKQSPTSEERDI